MCTFLLYYLRLFIFGFLLEIFHFVTYFLLWQSRDRKLGLGLWYVSLICPGTLLILFVISFQPFHPDSNSKVIGNGEGLGDETADSISSVLRKEIEGKSLFPNLMCLSPLLKVKTH